MTLPIIPPPKASPSTPMEPSGSMFARRKLFLKELRCIVGDGGSSIGPLTPMSAASALSPLSAANAMLEQNGVPLSPLRRCDGHLFNLVCRELAVQKHQFATNEALLRTRRPHGLAAVRSLPKLPALPSQPLSPHMEVGGDVAPSPC